MKGPKLTAKQSRRIHQLTHHNNRLKEKNYNLPKNAEKASDKTPYLCITNTKPKPKAQMGICYTLKPRTFTLGCNFRYTPFKIRDETRMPISITLFNLLEFFYQHYKKKKKDVR